MGENALNVPLGCVVSAYPEDNLTSSDICLDRLEQLGGPLTLAENEESVSNIIRLSWACSEPNAQVGQDRKELTIRGVEDFGSMREYAHIPSPNIAIHKVLKVHEYILSEVHQFGVCIGITIFFIPVTFIHHRPIRLLYAF